MKEIKNEIPQDEDSQNNRAGYTVTTSVSISREFFDIIKNNGLSPTEALRKGVAIELFEKGLAQYITMTNNNRAIGIKDLLKSFDELDDLERKRKEILKRLEDYYTVLEDYKDEVEKTIKIVKTTDSKREV